MKIIFYENRAGNWVDNLIRWKTATWKQRKDGSWKDLPSHVELLFSDGMMFSASQYEDRVRFKQHNFYSKSWMRIELPITSSQEAIVRDWCETQVGKKYDYLGILGFIIPFIKDNPNKWFCSEVCDEACKDKLPIFSQFKHIDSAKVSPAKLKTFVLSIIKQRNKQ